MKHNQAFIDYRETLPKRNNGIAWTIERFSRAVELLAPGFRVEDGQQWAGNRQKLWIICPEHGRYQVMPLFFLSSYKATGCRKCSAKATSESAGKKRSPRASTAEKLKGHDLYAKYGNYAEVARQLGRSETTIAKWLDPKIAERSRKTSAEWTAKNQERSKANYRRYKESAHGKASRRTHEARRRKLKRSETEWIDDIAGLVTLHSPPTTGADLSREQAVYLECERITKETSVEHHVDHIWPLSLGGPHEFWNLQIITAEENRAKHNKYSEEDQYLYACRIGMLFNEQDNWPQ